MANILVTGAAGFIGSHTTDLCLREGHRVIGVDNFRTGHPSNLEEAMKSSSFQFVEADVSTPGVLNPLLVENGVTAIIHLAALVSVQESMTNPDLNFLLNVKATHETAESARKHGVTRIVFASSAAIYGDTTALPISEDTSKEPISPYGAAKLASEVLLHGYSRSYGFTTICQRYFNVFGPRQDPASPYSGVISIFCKRYAEGKPVTIFGDGLQSRDFISVYDVARANLMAATVTGVTSGSHNICTGRQTTLLDVVSVFGEKYPKVDAPKHEAARTGDIVHSCGNPAAAEKRMGFRAEVDVKAGLRRLIEGM